MANNIIGTVGVGAQSVKPDWNQNDPNAKDYIKNRPGGYVIPPSVEITWDGDTTGKETMDAGNGITLVKIADEAPPIEKFAVGSDVATLGAGGSRYTAVITLEMEYNNGIKELTPQPEKEILVGDGIYMLSSNYALCIGITVDEMEVEGLKLSRGLWLSRYEKEA